jgi:hypothetical protein
MQTDLLGIISLVFDIKVQLLIIRVCCIYEIHEKKWKYYEAVNQLFMDLKKAYVPVRKEVLYNILIEFGIPMKPVRLIIKRLNETYGTVRVGKHLSATIKSFHQLIHNLVILKTI